MQSDVETRLVRGPTKRIKNDKRSPVLSFNRDFNLQFWRFASASVDWKSLKLAEWPVSADFDIFGLVARRLFSESQIYFLHNLRCLLRQAFIKVSCPQKSVSAAWHCVFIIFRAQKSRFLTILTLHCWEPSKQKLPIAFSVQEDGLFAACVSGMPKNEEEIKIIATVAILRTKL